MRQKLVSLLHDATTLLSLFSVAHSNSSRVVRRRWARTGFLHTASLSPGHLSLVIWVMSRSSNKEGLKLPSAISELMEAEVSAVIQPNPAGFMSYSMRSDFISPLSPATTISRSPKLSWSFPTCAENVGVLGLSRKHLNPHRATLYIAKRRGAGRSRTASRQSLCPKPPPRTRRRRWMR